MTRTTPIIHLTLTCNALTREPSTDLPNSGCVFKACRKQLEIGKTGTAISALKCAGPLSQLPCPPLQFPAFAGSIAPVFPQIAVQESVEQSAEHPPRCTRCRVPGRTAAASRSTKYVYAVSHCGLGGINSPSCASSSAALFHPISLASLPTCDRRRRGASSLAWCRATMRPSASSVSSVAGSFGISTFCSSTLIGGVFFGVRRYCSDSISDTLG